MSMPQFPKNDPDLTREQALHMILSSIAMEELALSNIVNAESANLAYVLKQNGQIGYAHTNDILAMNKSVTELLEMVMQNQLILKNKMEKVLTALSSSVCCLEPCTECCPDPCTECCPDPCTECCLDPCTECCLDPCIQCCPKPFMKHCTEPCKRPPTHVPWSDIKSRPPKDVYTCHHYRWQAKQPLPWSAATSHFSCVDCSSSGKILLREGQYALRFWITLNRVPQEDILFAFRDCYGNTVFPSYLRLQCPKPGGEITGSSTISIAPRKGGCLSLYLFTPDTIEINCATLRIEAI